MYTNLNRFSYLSWHNPKIIQISDLFKGTRKTFFFSSFKCFTFIQISDRFQLFCPNHPHPAISSNISDIEDRGWNQWEPYMDKIPQTYVQIFFKYYPSYLL